MLLGSIGPTRDVNSRLSWVVKWRCTCRKWANSHIYLCLALIRFDEGSKMTAVMVITSVPVVSGFCDTTTTERSNFV